MNTAKRCLSKNICFPHFCEYAASDFFSQSALFLFIVGCGILFISAQMVLTSPHKRKKYLFPISSAWPDSFFIRTFVIVGAAEWLKAGSCPESDG